MARTKENRYSSERRLAVVLYAGIDLHSTNNVVVVLDEKDKVVGRARLANNMKTVTAWLSPYLDALVGVVV